MNDFIMYVSGHHMLMPVFVLAFFWLYVKWRQSERRHAGRVRSISPTSPEAASVPSTDFAWFGVCCCDGMVRFKLRSNLRGWYVVVCPKCKKKQLMSFVGSASGLFRCDYVSPIPPSARERVFVEKKMKAADRLFTVPAAWVTR